MVKDSKGCKHDYIIDFGKNEMTNEDYKYCLNCGERILDITYGSLYIDARFYLEEYPTGTELARQQKVAEIKRKYKEFMLERSMPYEPLVIDEFKSLIEQSRDKHLEGKIH